MSLHRCRVVLVRPRIAANIGAIARVMRNLGLGHLVLVAPEADPARQAIDFFRHFADRCHHGEEERPLLESFGQMEHVEMGPGTHEK
ncbi:MAG TPA: hypothetical protein VNK04_06810 [Gemmataceae bacterium]|nr:hypothetical protein [Gemmataceae bacterium]